MTSGKEKLVAVILAGGKALRMEKRDKPLQSLAGKELIQHVIDRVGDSVSEIVISANYNHDRYEKFGKPLVADLSARKTSPLLGIYSAMDWFANSDLTPEFMICLPADVPVFPADVIELLAKALIGSNAEVAYLESAGQSQPLFSIWRLSLRGKIREEINRGNLGVRYVIEKFIAVRVPVNTHQAADFMNINSLSELREIEELLTRTN